jgi:hypothetical protein
MKKILLIILIVALGLTGIMTWIVLAWIISILLSFYIYKLDVIYWFILSFVMLGFLGKSIIKINSLKGLVKFWNNIRKYFDLD